MKRTLFITIGAISLLLIFSLWVYLLIFGAPKEVNEVFSSLGLVDPTPITGETVPLEVTAQLNIGTAALSQLTTRPVAGFSFISDASSTSKIIYAERGVGHIYEIDIASGVETRVFAKTFLAINEAEFAPDGKAVVLISYTDEGRRAYLEEIGANTPDHQLPDKADNITFVSPSEVRYTTINDGYLTGFSYDLDDRETNSLFSSPLTDIDVIWDEAETLLYSRSAPRLSGALYRVEGETLYKVGEGGYAFSAFTNTGTTSPYVMTRFDVEKGQLASFALKGDVSSLLPIMALPEKCTASAANSDLMWCASPIDNFSRGGYSDWQKGTVTSTDLLWQVSFKAGNATVLNDLQSETRRAVDVTELEADPYGRYLIFKNKLDDTLWLRLLN